MSRTEGSTPMELTGLIAAAFTPLNADGTVNLERVPALAEHLVRQGISGAYLCGTTGEGPLLSTRERMAVADAYLQAIDGRMPVIVQVGHSNLHEACELARHAAASGADAVSANFIGYYPLTSEAVLVRCMKEIAAAAPALPFYYYHIPQLTGLSLRALTFLEAASGEIPSLRGIKFSATQLDDLQQCLAYHNGAYDTLFGVDEMLLSGLACGVRGAVGSTYNIFAPLYANVIQAFESGDLKVARESQEMAARLVSILVAFRGVPALKAAMSIIDLDCGPSRLPLETLTDAERTALEAELRKAGFFDWIEP